MVLFLAFARGPPYFCLVYAVVIMSSDSLNIARFFLHCFSIFSRVSIFFNSSFSVSFVICYATNVISLLFPVNIPLPLFSKNVLMVYLFSFPFITSYARVIILLVVLFVSFATLSLFG